MVTGQTYVNARQCVRISLDNVGLLKELLRELNGSAVDAALRPKVRGHGKNIQQVTPAVGQLVLSAISA